MNFISWWQHLPEHLNPAAFTLGPVKVHWYGIMYVIAFLQVYFLICYRLKSEKEFAGIYDCELISDFMIWAMAAVLIGGRLGYVLFYDFRYFIANPFKIISPFDFSSGKFVFTGIYGMSYHGGVLGLAVAGLWFCKRRRISFFKFADLFSSVVPLGYTFGRLGNFINGELYGRITSVPWGMYFPMDAKAALRHPSQLYEAFFEGIFLFAILWGIRKKKIFDGFSLCIYLAGYGIVRFLIEFVREPDPQLGFIFAGLSMGQILCIIMLFISAGIYLARNNNPPK